MQLLFFSMFHYLFTKIVISYHKYNFELTTCKINRFNVIIYNRKALIYVFAYEHTIFYY